MHVWNLEGGGSVPPTRLRTTGLYGIVDLCSFNQLFMSPSTHAKIYYS